MLPKSGFGTTIWCWPRLLDVSIICFFLVCIDCAYLKFERPFGYLTECLMITYLYSTTVLYPRGLPIPVFRAQEGNVSCMQLEFDSTTVKEYIIERSHGTVK